MGNQQKDTVKMFSQLRKQLAPALSPESRKLMLEMERMAGAGPLPAPTFQKRKTISHDERVAKHLKF